MQKKTCKENNRDLNYQTAKQFLFHFHNFNFGCFYFYVLAENCHKFKSNKKEITNNLFVKTSINHCVNSLLCITSLVKRSTWKTFDKKYGK